ncbi:hypothetical protein MXD62_14635 [Frankia sp. Mgl5]|nr:hypothetical protein [Frankia sp. Mgl5]MCK9928394.1 hypothetical protein [Frankia sp. Mgl5]
MACVSSVAGVELVLVEGMGHGLPRELWSRLAGDIAGLVRRAEKNVEAG